MISYKFCGNVPNKQVLDFYGRNKIDCFVLTSEFEGLPVSIMEAESAGIPIVATDVGGISEMINGNGVLLSSAPSSEEIANAILSILNADDLEKSIMRRKSLGIWNENFDARRNAVDFVSYIKNEVDSHANKILFLTEGYPYIDSDKSFLESELKEMLRNYDVTIVARTNESITSENIENANKNINEILEDISNPKNIHWFAYEERWSISDNIWNILCYFFKKDIKTERREIIKSKNCVSTRMWESVKYYCKALNFYKWLKDKSGLYDEIK